MITSTSLHTPRVIDIRCEKIDLAQNTTGGASVSAADTESETESVTEYDTDLVAAQIKQKPTIHDTRFFDVKRYTGYLPGTDTPIGNFIICKMITAAYRDKRKYYSPDPVYFLAKFRVKNAFRGKTDPLTNQKYSSALFAAVIDLAQSEKIPLCLRPTLRAKPFYLREINHHFGTEFTPRGPQFIQPQYPNFFTITDPGITGGYAWRFDVRHKPIEAPLTRPKSEHCIIS